jgi:hypothetical protein
MQQQAKMMNFCESAAARIEQTREKCLIFGRRIAALLPAARKCFPDKFSLRGVKILLLTRLPQ